MGCSGGTGGACIDGWSRDASSAARYCKFLHDNTYPKDATILCWVSVRGANRSAGASGSPIGGHVRDPWEVLAAGDEEELWLTMCQQIQSTIRNPETSSPIQAKSA